MSSSLDVGGSCMLLAVSIGLFYVTEVTADTRVTVRAHSSILIFFLSSRHQNRNINPLWQLWSFFSSLCGLEVDVGPNVMSGA